MRRSILLIVLIMFIFGGLYFCKQEKTADSIDLNVNFSRPLYSNIFTNITYKWELKKGIFNYDPDYKIFVHFWQNSKKSMLIQDDHEPEWNVENWKSGAEIEYTHENIYIPDFIDYFDLNFEGKEKVTLTVGLWKPNTENSKIIVHEEELEFEPRSMDYPEITYAEGWYPEEKYGYDIDSPWKYSWKWTKKQASVIADNVRKDLKLYFYGGVDKSIFKDQKVTVKINDEVLDEFIPEEGKFKKIYELKQEELGGRDEFRIFIETNKTFIPSKIKDSEDNRELGIQVFLLNLMPKKK